jgi:hypothetical protein
MHITKLTVLVDGFVNRKKKARPFARFETPAKSYKNHNMDNGDGLFVWMHQQNVEVVDVNAIQSDRNSMHKQRALTISCLCSCHFSAKIGGFV